MVNLVIETDKYKVYEMKFGTIIINTHAEKNSENLNLYKNALLQGDDSINFLNEIEVFFTTSDNTVLNDYLSNYDDVMRQANTIEEFAGLGIKIKEITPLKTKILKGLKSGNKSIN